MTLRQIQLSQKHISTHAITQNYISPDDFVAVAAHSIPDPQATIEVAVGWAAGHVPLVVHELSGRKGASADIELHASGAVAAIVVTTVAVAAVAVEGSFAAVVLAGRPNPHPISAPVLRDLCAGSLMPFLQRCWRSGLNEYSTSIHNISITDCITEIKSKHVI